MKTTKVDVSLHVDDIDPEDLPAVWQRLSLVAEGFSRDGHEVGLHTHRFNDDGDDETELVYPSGTTWEDQ